MQSGTRNCPHTQTDKPLSWYDCTSETVQAYPCMTFTAAIMPQNICERVWWNFSCSWYKQVTPSQMFSSYCQTIMQIVISEHLWGNRPLSTQSHDFAVVGYKQTTSSQMFSGYCLMTLQIVITEQFVRKSHLGHAQLWSCGCLIQAHEVPHRCSAIIICKIMRQ